MGWGGRREGGSGWGTHVNPWLIHVNVWQKPLQYCKVINLQVIKINGKKMTGAYSMSLSSIVEWKEKSGFSLFMISSDWYQILALEMG